MTEVAKIQVRIEPGKSQYFKLFTISINNHKCLPLNSKTLSKAIFKKIKILQKKSSNSLKLVQQTSFKSSLHK